MNGEVIRALVAVVAASAAGGLTNTVAIWMLFHPHRPPKWRRWTLRFFQGAVPKNQRRLAKAIGHAVGNRLLTEEDLGRVLAEPEFRRAFDDGLQRFLHGLLEVERGSLADLLGPETASRAQPFVDELLEFALARIDERLRSPEFEEAVRERASDLADFLQSQPVRDILTPAREERAADAAEAWLESAAAKDAFRDTVAEYLRHAADSILASPRKVREMLPPGLLDAVEEAVADFMPLALGRLGRKLDDPEVRKPIEKAVRDVLRRFLQDLRFHQRVVARMVLSGDAVAKALDAIQVEGAERIAVIFRQRRIQEAIARGIRESIGDLLDRRVAEVFHNPDDAAVDGAVDAAASWVADWAKGPSARAFARERVEAALAKASAQTWGELLGGAPPERMAEWAVAAARSEVAATIYRDGLARMAASLLERPIGRPARLLPAGAAQSLGEAASEPAWKWVQAQIPAVVSRLDVARRVEEKVRDYPVEKMEELVRRVTERELRLIVWLGYALGAFIGCLLVAIDLLLG